MTKQDWIKWNLEQIARATGRKWGSGVQTQVKFVRGRLERIEHLLQEPEPETLASSVLRLTNLCNQLEAVNFVLRNDLTEMTLNFNAAEKYASALKADLDNKSRLYLEEAEHARRQTEELDVAIRSNAWLRERLSFKDESLRACRASEELLKKRIEELEWIKQGLESRSVEEENRKLKRELNRSGHELETVQRRLETLKREFVLQERYIEILKQERRHNS